MSSIVASPFIKPSEHCHVRSLSGELAGLQVQMGLDEPVDVQHYTALKDRFHVLEWLSGVPEHKPHDGDNQSRHHDQNHAARPSDPVISEEEEIERELPSTEKQWQHEPLRDGEAGDAADDRHTWSQSRDGGDRTPTASSTPPTSSTTVSTSLPRSRGNGRNKNKGGDQEASSPILIPAVPRRERTNLPKSSRAANRAKVSAQS